MKLSSADYVVKEGTSPTLYIETDTDLCDFYLDEVIVMKTDGTVLPEGDVNNDGEFNIIDLAVFQKWMLGCSDVTLDNWEAADLCKDGTLNVLDICIMKSMLLNV